VEVGSNEILFEDSVRFAARAECAGVDLNLVVADGLFHVYHGFPALPEAREGTDRIGAFLARSV
jgi:acetyl esterase/lipase